jgi:hypothetical protein
MSTPMHAILTLADPALEINFGDAAPNAWELVVYGGTFDGATVKCARKLADTDDEAVPNALAWIPMRTPALDEVLTISAAGAGYSFSPMARCGKFKVYIDNPGAASAITVGVGW